MVSGRKTVKKTTAGTVRKRAATTAAAKRTSGKTAAKGAAGKNTLETRPESVMTPAGVIDLGDVLVVSNVLEWQQKNPCIFDGTDTLTLDGGKIEQIDGTGLQLIAAIVKEAGRRGMRVAWTGASQTLCAGAAQLGLAGMLCLDADVD